MINWLTALKHYFAPPQAGVVTYKYYVRTGACHNCGQCCSAIHLVHNDHAIADEAEFARLQEKHEDYRHFIPDGKSDVGLVFRCKHLTPDKRCGIYDDRPLFCRKYPSETTLLFGSNLAQECGFRFSPKVPFGQVLQRIAKRPPKSPGRLLFDLFKPKTAVGIGEGRILPLESARPAVDEPPPESTP